MKKKTICNEIKESLVDLCEGTLSKERASEIKGHIATCKSCKKEMLLTQKLLANTEQTTPDEKYFEQLSSKISKKISGPCEEAQDYIVSMLIDEPIPADMAKHLKECAECKKETVFVENMIKQMHNLSVPLPNEKYFQQQLYRIDHIIETLPSKRVAKVESKEITTYIIGIFEAVRSTLMQPYAAVAISAMVVMLVVGARFYSSKESIEEKQISLSDVLRTTNSVSTIDHDGKIITDPSEDEKLQYNTTGSAKKEEKNKNFN